MSYLWHTLCYILVKMKLTREDKIHLRKARLIEYTIRDLGYRVNEVQGLYENAMAAIDVLDDKELVKYIEDRLELEGF